MMVRILVQIGAALRAQSQAIRLAQRLQRQFLDQRVAQKRLNIGPGSAFKQRIRILRLVFAGDNVDFLFLDAALAITNVDDELDIYVGNIKKFTALPGSSGDKYAVRITSVVREEQ